MAICCSKSGVANPNWSLGRIGKKIQYFFGSNFGESNGKSLTFDPVLGRRKFFLGRGLAIPDLNTQL
jgi:hypothetical protein